MPIYTLRCSRCDERSEHIMGMDENSMMVGCPFCGCGLMRGTDRDWGSDLPMIQGDTVAGGFDHTGYDDVLGAEVRGRVHRRDLMEEKNLVEFTPDPTMERYREDIRHVRRNSIPTDLEAHHAVKQIGKEMGAKRTQMATDDTMKKVKPKIDKAFAEARAKASA